MIFLSIPLKNELFSFSSLISFERSVLFFELNSSKAVDNSAFFEFKFLDKGISEEEAVVDFFLFLFLVEEEFEILLEDFSISDLFLFLFFIFIFYFYFYFYFYFIIIIIYFIIIKILLVKLC